ncbi:3-keto-5-aminohexanoate cleavage protein [Pacificispira sp.]|uniref:3-keto-5-aminohexanoate cleavage protein n=1 Tax=Pacificispira sp. TaxID=2888761 RepID=UPI003B52115D
MSSTPCIITVAITGSVPKKEDNPAVPISVAEQIESTQEAFEAGATLVHVHMRNEEDQSVSSDPAKFDAYLKGVRKHCPGMIVQFSTGGRGRDPSSRGSMIHLKPDMASLATGSVNFPSMVYENHPDLVRDLAAAMKQHGVKPEIEIFDLAMLYAAKDMVDRGEIVGPAHVQFVSGLKNALPVRREVLEFELKELRELMPDATWTAAAIGRHQLQMNHWALELGGHCRTGLEDNIKFDKDRLAASNAELVARVADLSGKYNRHPASVAEARGILGL